MKKIKLILLKLIILISTIFILAGCGNEKTENNQDKNISTEVLSESKDTEVNENKKLTEVVSEPVPEPVPLVEPNKVQQHPVKTNSSGFQVAETIVPSEPQQQAPNVQEPLDSKAQTPEPVPEPQPLQPQPGQQPKQQPQNVKPVVKKVKCNIYHQGTERDQMVLINGQKIYVDKNGCIN